MNNVQPNIVSLLVVVSALGLVTFAIITATSFIKISVVMFLLRNALGIQQTPPNIVLYSIALVLTVFISTPVMKEIYKQTQDPALSFNTIDDWAEVGQRVKVPIRTYLQRFTRPAERDFFLAATRRVWPKEIHETTTSGDLGVLLPAFMISELRRAFEIGFLIYLPFIAVDLIVSGILMALGMSMVPPTTIAVPFKLFLFVGIEGWSTLFHGLVLSYA